MRERQNLAGTVFDVQHADVRPACGDDLPAAWVKPAGVEVTLALLVPPQIAVMLPPMAALCSQKQNSLSAGVAGRSPMPVIPRPGPAQGHPGKPHASRTCLYGCFCAGHCQERGPKLRGADTDRKLAPLSDQRTYLTLLRKAAARERRIAW